MNLSEPLDGMMSAADAAVLRVLSRADAGFSGRQVHRLTGLRSTSSVNRALGGLAKVGLITAESRPPSIIYRVNRDHALWPAVESGLSARSRVFESIDRFCADELPPDLGLTVIVYGSVARRESTPESDIDLFVVYPDGIDPEDRADFNYRLGAYVERLTGNETQIFSVDRSELEARARDGDALVENVLTDGILLHGSPLEVTPRVSRS